MCWPRERIDIDIERERERSGQPLPIAMGRENIRIFTYQTKCAFVWYNRGISNAWAALEH